MCIRDSNDIAPFKNILNEMYSKDISKKVHSSYLLKAQKDVYKRQEQMKAAEGVTEELKRTHQMEWVQRCNNIHNRAEEIILREIIYS